jgi:hypothetical protein
MSDRQQPPKQFHHVGLRATERQPAEHYVYQSKCWVTNPHEHLYRIEYLRYERDSPVPEEFRNEPHIAYTVDDLEPHLAGKEVILEPFQVGEPYFATVAFTREHGLFVEYMKIRPGCTWFDGERATGP